MTDRVDAETCVLRLLSRRDHSTGELREKLHKRGFSAEVIEAVVADCVACGQVDDDAFARHQAAVLVEQGWGPIQIRERLVRHGIERDHAAATLNELEVDWVTRARARVAQKYGTLEPGDHERAFRHLTYRGFPGSVARRALFD